LDDGKERYTETVKVPVIDKNNDIAGVVGLILDITEKKEAEEKLRYLSFTYTLTGLYNRTYFDEKVKELLCEEYLPVGVIIGDANGFKLVNDTLGHNEGDELLKLISQVLRDVCNEGQLIFRTGGDEYVILIANSSEDECESIIKNIIKQCKVYKHGLINVSISLGAAITNNLDNSIYNALKEAEDKVYRQKLLQKSSFNSSIMYSLQIGLQTKSLETEEHTEKGYRIVKASDQLDNVARGVLTHHERWAGKGYPLKLKGEGIPLIARIVSVADSYDTMINNNLYKRTLSKEDAIKELQRCAGKQFDPDIVRVFIEYLEESKLYI